MKARKVKGLKPDAPLGDNALLVLAVRIEELRSFAAAARDPANQAALHDMRIAAKRVRYVLELTAPALGRAASRGATRAKRLQTLLGDIHDCDELLRDVRDHAKRLRAEDAAEIRRNAGERAADVSAAAARTAPNRTRYRGLESLRAYLRARRDVLHARFVREWGELEREAAWTMLLDELKATAAAGNSPAAR